MAAPRFRLSAQLGLSSLLLAALHLACRHAAGGVQNHSLLNRPELPAISNIFEWIALLLHG